MSNAATQIALRGVTSLPNKTGRKPVNGAANSASSSQKKKHQNKQKKQRALNSMQPFRPETRSFQTRPDILSPYLHSVAHQIIDPGNVVEIVNSPSPNTSYVVAKRFTRVVDYSLPAAQTQFSIFMQPNLLMPGFITNTGSTVFPLVAEHMSYDGVLSCIGITSPAGPGDAKAYGTFGLADGSHVMAHTTTVTDSAAAAYPGYLLSGLVGAGAEFACDYTNESDEEVRLQALYRAPAGVWTSMGSIVVPANGTAYQNAAMPTYSGFCWRVLTSNKAAQIVKVKAAFRSAQLTTSAGIDYAPAFASQIIDNEITLGRVLSMRFTATNTSNALSLGGNASCARVPPLFNPFDHAVDIPTSLSRLPPNRVYQGAAATGCSAFWMPEQLDEWTIDNIANKVKSYNESSFLLGHLSGLPAGATFRIKFSWLVEFYTPTQLFSPMITPNWGPEWEEVMHMLVALDAATCNPDSSGMFDRFLSSGRKYLTQAKDHYYLNQNTYQKLYKLLQTLGPLLVG